MPNNFQKATIKHVQYIWEDLSKEEDMAEGKCGGGKKLGVSYNFKSEKAFLDHIRKLCAGCQECSSVDLIKNMMEIGTGFKGRTHYLCSDCFQE